MKKPYNKLEEKIGVHFKQVRNIENVFVHRSYLNENKNFYLPSNEKLEFLGDSVLSLITSVYLYKNFPHLKEGDYTEIKAAIVRTESLAEASTHLGLGEYLLLSKGQSQEGGRSNRNILADCFEALIGAIFLDQGFDSAYQFVLRYLFDTKLQNIVQNQLYLSPKSHLQEYAQGKFKVTPNYTLIEQKGPEHKRIFKVVVAIKNKKLAYGVGLSKKQAEEQAAKSALEKLT